MKRVSLVTFADMMCMAEKSFKAGGSIPDTRTSWDWGYLSIVPGNFRVP